MVKILVRDVNGKQETISLEWSDVCSYVESHLDELETEILMVLFNEICIYSQLGHNPITWEDLTGFFG
ncbi:MAG: hypothetical protein ACI3V2_10930 [Faecousia sp.]